LADDQLVGAAMVNLGLQDSLWLVWIVVAVWLLALWAWRRWRG